MVGEDGLPVAGATVRIIEEISGRRWEIATRSDGRFLLDAVAVGTYRVDVLALGFRPESRDGVVVTLGQRLTLDFTLPSLAIELPALSVSARDDRIDRGRAGPAEVVSREAIEALPNIGRDFYALALRSPQVVLSPQTPGTPMGGIAIGGQNRFYNSFQIDGGIESDPYSGQMPGRQAFPRPLSLEAIEEIQVLTAPFDVRYGNFAGGLVNLVTRSGGNTVHGSVFGYFAGDALARLSLDGDRIQPFTSWQFGGTLSGPIVRDRAHFFVSADVQRQVVPDPGPLITDSPAVTNSSIGISYADALRFRTLLDTLYHLEPGGFGPTPRRIPAQDLFGKISVQLAANSQAEVTYHYVSGSRQDVLGRVPKYYALSSFAQQEPSTSEAVRLIWRGVLAGRWSNELLLGSLRLRDRCQPNASFPELRVTAGKGFLTAGTANGCPGWTLRQDVYELTDNATLGLGRHALTVGVHGEAMRFRDDQVQGSPGLWQFGSLDLLEAGLATLYQRTLPGPSWDGGTNFRAYRLAAYAQDRWNVTPRLTLTAGLRLDVPILPDAIPTYTPLRDSLGIDTGRRPSGNVVWLPRVGVTYDLRGDGRTTVRGGIGLFSGQPPYRWISNAYRDDGVQELFIDCPTQGPMPRFDPVTQPGGCVNAAVTPRLSVFGPGTQFPENLKVALGLDHRLPGGLAGSVDVVFTRSVHQLYLTDANLAPPSGVSVGEANRPLYGTINPMTGAAVPKRLAAGLGRVVRISNRDGDHAVTLTAQLRTETGRTVEASAFYAYTRARDRMSILHVQGRAMLEGTVLDGTLENRQLGVSWFEVPHRIQATISVRLPYRTRLALLYSAASGRPFTYAVEGDANADGLGTTLLQDPIYVPRDSQDITLTIPANWSALDSVIARSPCLRTQRGRVLARNSCRNPWFGVLSARASKAFPTLGGHAVDVSVDLYNVLNLLNGSWGRSRYDAATFAVKLLVLRGYDTSAGRGIYEYWAPTWGQIDDLASRWQMALRVKYLF